MEPQLGTLSIYLSHGEFLVDHDTITKMDPYVVFKLNQQHARSKIHQEAGLHPVWEQCFIFRCALGDTLKFECWDQDLLHDDEIASGCLQIDSSFVLAKSDSIYYKVNLKNEPAGQISMGIQFVPDDADSIQLHKNLTTFLNDQNKTILELKDEIKREKEAPPRPKVETLFLKQILDKVVDLTKKEEEEIERQIEEVGRPFLEEIGRLGKSLEAMEHSAVELRDRQIKMMEDVNGKSDELNLMKTLMVKGSLVLNVKELRLEKDGKMSVQVMAIMGKEVVKTDKQKLRKWDQKFLLSREKETTITLQVIEKNKILGFGGIDLGEAILKQGKKKEEEVVLIKNGQKIGTLTVEYGFTRD